jgi:cellulose 1,4-beta-cellobiosidase
VVADVSPTNLHIVAYNNLGKVLDNFTLVKPPAPDNLAATPGVGQVALTWNPVAGSTNYTVWYGTTNGGPYPTKKTSTNTSATVTGLANGTNYYFVVTATDTNGPSAVSAQVSAIPNNMRPVISSVGTLTNGSFALEGVGAAGQTYVLLTASNLTPPLVWAPIATNTADANGAFSFADLQATNYQQRFYRITTP